MTLQSIPRIVPRALSSTASYSRSTLPSRHLSSSSTIRARSKPVRTPFDPALRQKVVEEAQSTVNRIEEEYVDPSEALRQAREKAWYLETEDDPSESTSSSSPWIVDPETGAPKRRTPRFVTFDPNRTTQDVGEEVIQALPASTPEYLKPLYAYLTSDQARDIIDPTSVRFIRTRDAPEWSIGEGSLIQPAGEDGPKPTYEWIIVAVVKGYGKGVIGRAERALRVWVSRYPSFLRTVLFDVPLLSSLSLRKTNGSFTKTLSASKAHAAGENDPNSQGSQKTPTGQSSVYPLAKHVSTSSRPSGGNDGISRGCGLAQRGKRRNTSLVFPLASSRSSRVY